MCLTFSDNKVPMIIPEQALPVLCLLQDELFRAVEEGQLESVEQLVHHIGPSVTTGRKGHTLLHVAAENNQTHVALFLLKFISPNVINHDGQTPAHLAAMKGHTQVMHILLSDPHMDPDKRDLTGNTYTHWVGCGFDSVVQSHFICKTWYY